MRRWPLLLVIAAATMVSGIGGSCSCITLCEESGERVRFEGALLSIDDEQLLFAADGETIAIEVRESRARLLDVGEQYRVTAVRQLGGGLASHVNGGCGCTEINITHDDGTRINTGLWVTMNEIAPVRALLAAVVAIPLLMIAAVVVIQRLRGRSGDDPYRDMPYDEWIDF